MFYITNILLYSFQVLGCPANYIKDLIMTKLSIESISIKIFPDGRLDTKNAATYLGLKEKTLAMMRGNGTGPKFIKRGRVFYFKEDLDEWLNAPGRFICTAQAFTKKGD
jgi:hypothetical protein